MSDSERQRIRIECPDGLPTSAAVYLVQPGGSEVPLVDADLRGITWTCQAGEAAVATLQFECAAIDAVGAVDHGTPVLDA